MLRALAISELPITSLIFILRHGFRLPQSGLFGRTPVGKAKKIEEKLGTDIAAGKVSGPKETLFNSPVLNCINTEKTVLRPIPQANGFPMRNHLFVVLALIRSFLY